MDLIQAVLNRRTIRRFAQKPVEREKVICMLNCARVTSCASNRQRLRYIVVQTPQLVEAVFRCTAWAGLVKPRRNPEWGKSAPDLFIAVLGPAFSDPTLQADAGAAIQSMQLAAYAQGLGCCWMGAIRRGEICKILQIPDNQELLYVLAAGYPAEEPLSEDSEGPVEYYLDNKDRLHVPKLTVETVTIWK